MQGFAHDQLPVALLHGPELRKLGFGAMFDEGLRFAIRRAAAAFAVGDFFVTVVAWVACAAAALPCWVLDVVVLTVRRTIAGVLFITADWCVGEGVRTASAARRTFDFVGTVVLDVLVVLDVDVVSALVVLTTTRWCTRASVVAVTCGVTSTDASCTWAGVVVDDVEKSAETGSADVRRNKPPTTVTNDPATARPRVRRRCGGGVGSDSRPARDASLSSEGAGDAASVTVFETPTSESPEFPFFECPCVDFIVAIFESQTHVALYGLSTSTQFCRVG